MDNEFNKLKRIPYEASITLLHIEGIFHIYSLIYTIIDEVLKMRERNQPLDKYVDRLKKNTIKHIKKLKKLFMDSNMHVDDSLL